MKFDHVFFEGVAALPHRRRWVKRSAGWSRKSGVIEGCVAERSFIAALLRHAQLPADAYRESALFRRVPACLRLLRAPTLAAAEQMLIERPSLVQPLLGVVLLGVTDFFRDAEVFETLKQSVIPQLMSLRSSLRVWSAACSEGQELYSVALLLAQAGRLQTSELVGTDFRPEAIDLARSGVFDAPRVASLGADWARYFTTSGSNSVVAPDVRASTHWKVADLFSEVEPGPWDMILWRNMAIYLEEERANAVWRRLCSQLSPGGYLITGKADAPPKTLPMIRTASCVFRKDFR